MNKPVVITVLSHLLIFGAQAQAQHGDHGQHMPETQSDAAMHSDEQHQSHGPMTTTQESAAMAHDAMEQTTVAPLRDPHAYANGYELTSGLYTLDSGSQISLADETSFTGLWMDRLEYVESHDADATEIEGHAWIGDSYNRFLLRSEVEFINDVLETAEVDLLHSRAISPFWNVQFGARREFGEEASRNWASIGFSGLAPYWFEVDASLFIGEGGNTLLDIEAEYEILLTQRLVMQPRIDIHTYGKTDAEMGHGKGLSTLKTGFRMRYEFDRQLAPYLGVERVLKYGETADLLPPGQDREDTHWIIGFKFWF